MQEIKKITSRANVHLANARKVRDGKSNDLIFLEGVRLTDEALRSPVALRECIFTPAFRQSKKGEALLEGFSSGVVLIEVNEDMFRSVADTVSSQGVIVIAERPVAAPFDKPKDQDIFVYLNQINDPSNVGAILRTSEAAGVTGVFVSKRSADPFSPKALRSGMGSNLRIPIHENTDLEMTTKWAKKSNIEIRAADVSGRISYSDVDWTKPSLVVFGSEAHGLDEQSLALVDEVFRIPMKNDVESLNLAVSAGVVLFEAVRQNSP